MVRLPGGADLLPHLRRHLDRNGERQALEPTGAGVNLRVDTHHLAARIEQRPARVARVNGCVGLDEGHVAVVGQRAPLGADHTGRHRVLETKRRADGQHPLAHLQITRIAQFHRRQVLRVDLEHGHVGLRIGAQHLGAELAPVGELDGHFVGVLDHVGVGEHHAVGADDEARALAAHGNITRHLHALRHAEAAEEFLERVGRAVVVIAALGQRGALRAAHADVDHGWAVLRGDLREAGQRLAAGLRQWHRYGLRHGLRLAACHQAGTCGAQCAGGYQRQDESAGGGCKGVHGLPFLVPSDAMAGSVRGHT